MPLISVVDFKVGFLRSRSAIHLDFVITFLFEDVSMKTCSDTVDSCWHYVFLNGGVKVLYTKFSLLTML
jgi:hypothetical protein